MNEQEKPKLLGLTPARIVWDIILLVSMVLFVGCVAASVISTCSG